MASLYLHRLIYKRVKSGSKTVDAITQEVERKKRTEAKWIPWKSSG